MTTVLNPIFESGNDYCRSTKNRFFSVILPIQATKHKTSDFTSYLANPLIDCFILEPMFALDASIHLINAMASWAKGVYLWSIMQQATNSFVDEGSAKEFAEAYSCMAHAGSAVIAQSLNGILSTLSLFTRPIASLAHALNVEEEPTSTYDYDSSYS